MAYDFSRFFADTANVVGAGVMGAAAGVPLGPLGMLAGAGAGAVGGLVQNHQRNTNLDKAEQFRQQAEANQAAIQQQLLDNRNMVQDYANQTEQWFKPYLSGLQDNADQAKQQALDSFKRRNQEFSRMGKMYDDSLTDMQGLQGTGVFGDLIRRAEGQANPYADGGQLATDTLTQAGAQMGAQRAGLTASLASRGLLGGPGELAAMAALQGSQGEQLFNADLQRRQAATQFGLDQEQQIRDYMQSGGGRSDAMAMALAELKRDPTLFNAAVNMYGADQGVSQAALVNQMQGVQMADRAKQNVFAMNQDNLNSTVKAQDSSNQMANINANQAQVDTLSPAITGVSTFLREMPQDVRTGLSNTASGVMQKATSFAGQVIPPVVQQSQGLFNRFIEWGNSNQDQSLINAGRTGPHTTGGRLYTPGFQQPDLNPRPGVGGRRMGGAGLPYR